MSATLETATITRRPPLWRRPLYRAGWRAQRRLWSRTFVDVGGDHRGTLFVAGCARSGTTWVAELLNYRNEYRYLFEPLTPSKVPAFGHFVRGQYLRPDNRDPAYQEPMRAVVTGRMRNRWLDHYNRKPISTRRLVKDVYANLLLEWLHGCFPGMRIVFVIRHPGAVISSRLRLETLDHLGLFEADLDRYLAQDDLLADFLAPHLGAIADASSPLEQQAFWWCIENAVPLTQMPADAMHIAWYEQLLADPSTELPRLGAYLGRTFRGSAYTRMRRHSLTTGRSSVLKAGDDPATTWSRRWSRDDIRTMLGVLARFGLDEIYGDDPMPRVEGLAAIRGVR